MKDSDKKPQYSYDELKRKYIDKEPSPSFLKTKEASKSYSLFVVFIINIIVLTTLGLVIGYWIDSKLNTLPIFMLLLTILGIGAAFRNLIKAISLNDEDKGVQNDGNERK